MRETLERRFTLAKRLIDASRPDDAAAIGVDLRSSAASSWTKCHMR
jgi:hypothetical protein